MLNSAFSKASSCASEVRIAYSDFKAWIGILLGAVAIFNIIFAVFSLPLSDLCAALLSGYRILFHSIADAALFWIALLFPNFVIPEYLKDLIVIYLFTGAAIARSLNFYLRIPLNSGDAYLNSHWWAISNIYFKSQRFLKRFLPENLLIFTIFVMPNVIWPYFIADLKKYPILMRKKDFDDPGWGYYYRVGSNSDPEFDEDASYQRIYAVIPVLVLQIIALSCVVFVISAANAAL